MAHDVFISYSSRDKPVADSLCARLEGDNVRCWIAPRDVLPGVPYAESLTDALSASRLMVLILSTGSNESRHVMREVESAINRGIPIIPFRIENVLPSKALDYYLKSIHWLDALTPPLERHLETLSRTVKAVLSREVTGVIEQQAAVNRTLDRAVAEVSRRKPKFKWWLVVSGVTAVVVLGGLVLWAILGGPSSKSGTTSKSLAKRPTATDADGKKQPASSPTTDKQQPATSVPQKKETVTSVTRFALRFEQDGDRVEFDDAIVKTRQEWTVEGWVMPRDPLPKAGPAMVFIVDPAWISLRNPGPRWGAFGPMTRPAYIAHAKERAFTNRWDHLAMCYGPAGLSFFVNGERQGDALPLAIHIGESRVQVCPVGNKSKSEVEFRGDIDELRISDMERYRDKFVPAGRFEPDEHTLALYHFDEGEGETVKDSSRHKRHGRITHAKWVTSRRPSESDETRSP